MDTGVYLSGRSQQQLALTTSGAQTGILDAGFYDIWCDVECYIAVDATASDVTTANGYLYRTGTTLSDVWIPAGQRLGGVVASGTGTLSYHRVR